MACLASSCPVSTATPFNQNSEFASYVTRSAPESGFIEALSVCTRTSVSPKNPYFRSARQVIEIIIREWGQAKVAGLSFAGVSCFAIIDFFIQRAFSRRHRIDRISAPCMVSGKAQMPAIVNFCPECRYRGAGMGFDISDFLQHEASSKFSLGLKIDFRPGIIVGILPQEKQPAYGFFF